jgi:peptidoglycan/LPS O-acetylase OafA/YrhL
MLNKLPLIGPTWMLSMFLLFYWLFSLAFIFRRESILIPVFSLWILGILAYSSSLWNPNLPEEWSLILFKHRNIEFIFGYLGGKLLLSRKVGLKGGKWIFTLGIASLIAAIVLLNNNIIPYASRTFSYGIPLTLISLGLGALEQNNSPSPILKIIIHPWLVWLGGASYVLYLIHNMVLIVWGKIIPITPIQVPLITITVILISAIGYHFWEKPILRYVKTKMV